MLTGLCGEFESADRVVSQRVLGGVVGESFPEEVTFKWTLV